MTLFLLILVANSVTLLGTVIAAIRFPSWSYRILGVVSLAAALFALHQVVTGKYHPATLIVSALSSGLITLRVATNWTKFSGHQRSTTMYKRGPETFRKQQMLTYPICK